MDDAFTYRGVGRVRRVRLRRRAMLHGAFASAFVVVSYAALKLFQVL